MPLSNRHRHSWLLSKFICRQGEVARIVRMVDSDIPPILNNYKVTISLFADLSLFTVTHVMTQVSFVFSSLD